MVEDLSEKEMFKSRSQKYKKNIEQSRMTLFCMNCGKNNHGYTQCMEPLSSYGVICFHKSGVGDAYQVIMVQRRHSMNYVEFLRGKYDVNDPEYLVELFSSMTAREIEFITQNPDFERLRKDLGMDNNWKKSYKSEYDNSELKFNYILNLSILANTIYAINYIWNTEFVLPGNSSITPAEKYWKLECGISEKLNSLKTKYNPDGTVTLHNEPEWGIPKGKRQNKETDLQCAIREFQEETQINAGSLKIYKNIIPLEEIYKGGNGVEYRHIYFIAELIGNTPDINRAIKIQADNTQIESDEEIGAVSLFGVSDGLALIRDYHMSKKNIIQKAFYIINSINYFFKSGY